MKREGAVGCCPGPVQTCLDPLTPQQLAGSGCSSTLAILFNVLHFVLFLTLGNLSLVLEQAFLAFSSLCVFIMCLEWRGWPSREFTVPS